MMYNSYSYEQNRKIGDLAGRQAIMAAWSDDRGRRLPKGWLEPGEPVVDVRNKIDWVASHGSHIDAYFQTKTNSLNNSHFENNYMPGYVPVRCSTLKTMRNELEVYREYTSSVPMYHIGARYYDRRGDNFLFESIWVLDVADVKKYTEEELASFHRFLVPNKEGKPSEFINLPATFRIR